MVSTVPQNVNQCHFLSTFISISISTLYRMPFEVKKEDVNSIKSSVILEDSASCGNDENATMEYEIWADIFTLLYLNSCENYKIINLEKVK